MCDGGGKIAECIGGLKEQNSNNHSSGPAWTLTVRRTIAVCNGSTVAKLQGRNIF